MGFNVFFSWNHLWVSRRSWLEQLIIILFFSFFCCSAFSVDETFSNENKTKIIVKDLLEKAYNRTYKLPATTTPSNVSTIQEIRRANVLRSIAKKATRASGLLYSKHPITGLAVTFGLGYFTDQLIDTAFQKFTSSSKDSLGFYVMAKNSKTGELQKVYLEEEPSLFNPVFVNLQDNQVFTYEDAYGACQSSSYDETLNCAINKVFDEKSKKGNVSEFKVVSKDKSPIYADGLLINYSYKECFRNSSNCVAQRSFFTVRILKKVQQSSSSKPQIIWSEQVVSEDQVVLQDDAKIANFAKNAVSLNSDEFTDEERKVISNINPNDVRSSFSDPSLKVKDLNGFRYSEDMFDNVGRTSNSLSGNKLQTESNATLNNIDLSSPSVDMPDINPPTAYQILSPFNDFFPSLKNFEIQEREIQCPVWSGYIPYIESNVTLDGHCDYIEKNKNIISSLMLLIWGIVALRVLLSA